MGPAAGTVQPSAAMEEEVEGDRGRGAFGGGEVDGLALQDEGVVDDGER